jgi:hypothetical protein
MTTGPENPYGEQDPREPNPYGSPPPPSFDQHFGQQFGQPTPGSAYGQPYGYQQPYGYRPPAPKHPSATTAMVLGIIGLVGILGCGGITLVLSPFAWAIGSKAVKEIDAAPPGSVGGRSEANSGRVMGIIGTILLILGVIALIALIGLLVAYDGSSSTTYGDY